VFAVAVGLMVVPLLGVIPLAVEIGRLYLNKAELQNAADACALAAAQQLSQPVLPSNAFLRANTAGLDLAQRHMVDFQRTAIHSRYVFVEFSAAQNGAEWRTRDTIASPPATNDWRFARCTIERVNVPTWFLGMAGKTLFTTRAQAVARIVDPAVSPPNNCGLPTGMSDHCSRAASLYQ
jgi:Flp pilus assembly protein TadG